MPTEIAEITTLALVGLAILLIASGVKMVSQGQEWTVERFGKYTRTLTPGLSWIFPIIERIGYKQLKMEQVLDVPEQSVISADNAQVTSDAVCYFFISETVKASYQVDNLKLALQNLVMTNLRAVLGSMEIDEMLSNRDGINARLLEKLDTATDKWGVKVTRVEIKSLQPPQDLIESMELQMKAERTKRAEITEAEGKREAAIREAEGYQQAQILKAEGDKQAAFKEAEARERAAEAEAKATRMVSEAVAEGDAKVLNYFMGMKYVESLQELGTSDNHKIIMMPLDATSVMGSIAAIKELTESQKISK